MQASLVQSTQTGSCGLCEHFYVHALNIDITWEVINYYTFSVPLPVDSQHDRPKAPHCKKCIERKFKNNSRDDLLYLSFILVRDNTNSPNGFRHLRRQGSPRSQTQLRRADDNFKFFFGGKFLKNLWNKLFFQNYKYQTVFYRHFFMFNA